MRKRGLVRVLFLALVTLVLSRSALQSDWRYRDEPVEFVCEDEKETVLECPSCPDAISGVTPACVGVGVLFFLLGIAVGRGTVKSPPTNADIDREITRVTTSRTTEATRHGVPEAIPLLEKLRQDAIQAVQALL